MGSNTAKIGDQNHRKTVPFESDIPTQKLDPRMTGIVRGFGFLRLYTKLQKKWWVFFIVLLMIIQKQQARLTVELCQSLGVPYWIVGLTSFISKFWENPNLDCFASENILELRLCISSKLLSHEAQRPF